MDSDIKPFCSAQDDILFGSFTSGLGLDWHIISSSDLYLKGKVNNAKFKQAFIFKNSNFYLNHSFASNKKYKTSFSLFSQSALNIIPKIQIVSDFNSNSFSNLFSISYTEPYKKVVLGFTNTKIFCYQIYNFNNFGVANELSLKPNKNLKANYRASAWWNSDWQRVMIQKNFNGELVGKFYYKISDFKELAGKITTKSKNVQMLIGMKYIVKDNQVFRLRLDSEGFIGLQLYTTLSNWLTINTNSLISVRQLAKNNHTFLGFGINFHINYDS